jgi:hypothetical protein
MRTSSKAPEECREPNPPGSSFFQIFLFLPYRFAHFVLYHCAVVVDDPDGTSHTMPSCVIPAANFNGKAIRTVESHAKNGELSVLQKAFIEHFAFQCGYCCTPGFLNEGQICEFESSQPSHAVRCVVAMSKSEKLRPCSRALAEQGRVSAPGNSFSLAI